MAQFTPALLKRHVLPACVTLLTVVGFALLYSQKAPRTYETSARLLMDDRTKSVSELGRNLTKLPDNVPGGSSAIGTQAELVKSERVIKRALESILPPGQSEDPARKLTVGDLNKALKIKILPATNLLEITYQNNNPELVAQVVNAIADATVKEDAASIRQEASTVRNFLEKRVPIQQAEVKEAEAIESRYRQGTGVVSLETQTQSLVNSLADVENQERTIIAQLREAGTKGELLQKVTGVNSPATAYAATRIGQDEELKALRSRLAEVNNKVIETRSRLGDQHPDLIAALEQQTELEKLYRERAAQVIPEGQSQPTSSQEATDEVSRNILSQYITGEVDRTALEQKLATIQVAKADLKTRIASIPAKQQGLTAVTRQREESTTILQGIQTKLEEARVAEAQLISNIRIVDRATPPDKASSPKPLMILAVAIAAGLVLAVALSLLLEILDNTLHDSKELADLTNVRVLGKLPKLPFKPTYGHLNQFLDQAHLVEPYRMLLKTIDRQLTPQPNSLSSNLPRSPKIILVSSVMEGEGKSNLVAYLAAVAATLSYRTLVIDTDAHQAMQASLLGVSATPGLSNAIVRKAPLQEIIKPTAIEHLFLMPYGDLPKRPATVMESPDMAKLLESVGPDFDLVIVDTAVLSRSVDAVTLSPYASGLLLSTRPEHTRRDLLKQLLLDLQDNHIEPLGLVVNNNADVIPRLPLAMPMPPARSIEALPGSAPYSIR